MDADAFSKEIASINSQILDLKSLIPHLHGTLLSLPALSAVLASASDETPSIATARKAFSKQLAHNKATTYRLVSGINAFRVQDPDPHAVDGGKVLGLRIELPQAVRYGKPYFVFLVVVPTDGDDESTDRLLRVHRHTVPVAVPIDSLARKYLALPNKLGKPSRKQNLHAFARTLRNAILSYHSRVSAIEHLRIDAGISAQTTTRANADGPDSSRKVKGRGGIVSITSSDAEHFVEVEFRDGIIARLRVNSAGKIERVVVRDGATEKSQSSEARQRNLRQRIEGGDGRIEGTVKRILGGEVG